MSEKLSGNQLACLRGNEIILNAEHVINFSDEEIVRLVRHELGHYEYNNRRQAYATVALGLPSMKPSSLGPKKFFTGDILSEEVYNKFLNGDGE